MKGRWIWPVVGGFAGTGAILALYLGLVTLTSGSWEHALSLICGATCTPGVAGRWRRPAGAPPRRR
jgi:hypothetical protein